MLTIQEAAAHVRLTPWALYRAIPAAGLPTDTPDGARRVRRRDLRSSFATLLI